MPNWVSTKSSRDGHQKYTPLTIASSRMIEKSYCAQLRVEQLVCKVASPGSYEACCVSGRLFPHYPLLNINSGLSRWKSQHVSNAETVMLSVF